MNKFCDDDGPKVWLSDILHSVSAKYGATPDQLKGPQRCFSMARREFCVRASNVGKWSVAQIAKALNKDHTTVCYHIKMGMKDVKISI